MLTEHCDVKQEALSPHENCDLPLPTIIIAFGMAFSYPRFNGETDAASHIRLFLNVWNANHNDGAVASKRGSAPIKDDRVQINSGW